MRIIVTGASGYLGFHLTRYLEPDNEVLACYQSRRASFERATAVQLDIRDAPRCRQIINDFSPTHIIHAAAMTQTSECEESPATAKEVNVGGTCNLLDACKAMGAGGPTTSPHFILVSTDLVFNGRKPGGMYQEVGTTDEDAPAPLMVYGETKLEAEKAVENASQLMDLNATVFRSALIYGESTAPRACFLDWMLQGIRANEGCVFQDEYRSPVYVNDLCSVIKSACQQKANGTFHAGGPRRLSRYEFALLAAEAFGLPAGNVRGALARETPLSTPRPADVSLDISKAQKVLGYSPQEPGEALQAIARTNS